MSKNCCERMHTSDIKTAQDNFSPVEQNGQENEDKLFLAQ